MLSHARCMQLAAAVVRVIVDGFGIRDGLVEAILVGNVTSDMSSE